MKTIDIITNLKLYAKTEDKQILADMLFAAEQEYKREEAKKMKFIELQKYGCYSVIVRQDDKGNPIKIDPFVVAWGVRKDEDGEVIDWYNGNYFYNLFAAVDCARQKGCTVPSYYRLEEIATIAIDNLTNDDDLVSWSIITDEMELDDYEAEYFGISVDELSKYK